MDNAMGGAGGRLAKLFTPEAAENLAAWLDATATYFAEDVEPAPETGDLVHVMDACDGVIGKDCQCFTQPLTVAREITRGDQ